MKLIDLLENTTDAKALHQVQTEKNSVTIYQSGEADVLTGTNGNVIGHFNNSVYVSASYDKWLDAINDMAKHFGGFDKITIKNDSNKLLFYGTDGKAITNGGKPFEIPITADGRKPPKTGDILFLYSLKMGSTLEKIYNAGKVGKLYF